MIISCDQCHKKFEIDSNLIPKDGRLLECGSCNHKWFYKQDIKDKTEEIIIEPQLKNIEEKNISPIQSNISQIKELDTSSKKKEIIENKKIKKIGVLNIIIVFIISFVALVILIETFKDPISIFIPNIKFILNSLYEIIRDIILFFKDLIK
jgi:predicted Zn finger-like uncharacterized protein